MQKLSRSVLPLTLLLVASAVSAQRSQLDLQVHDMNGAEIGPVNVTVFSPQGEIVVQDATRKNGRLRIRLTVIEEPYRLLLQKDGHPERELEVQLAEGRDRTLTVQLWDEETARKQQAIDAFNEGIGKIQAGDAAGALPLFEQAVEIDPTIAAAHRTIAAILHNLGRLDDALESASKYVEMEPIPPDFASMFFDIFAAAGDPRAEDAKQLAIEAGMGAELAPASSRRAFRRFGPATTSAPSNSSAKRHRSIRGSTRPTGTSARSTSTTGSTTKPWWNSTAPWRWTRATRRRCA